MPHLVKDILPEFVEELRGLLLKVDRVRLADGVDQLVFLGPCGCDSEFCSSFYTAPEPEGAYGAGHSNLMLSPEKGVIILDLVDERICFVEVLDRSDVRRSLLNRESFPHRIESGATNDRGDALRT